MRRLILLATLVLGLLIPQSAWAGCQAVAGTVDVLSYPSHFYAFGGMYCTTNNGVQYDVRAYIQTNEGGTYHIAAPAFAHTFYNPVNAIYEYEWGYWTCVNFADNGGATRWRTKFVVENHYSGSIDTAVGESSTFKC